MAELRFPSSVSEALPLKVTNVPASKLAPFAGAVMLTVGAVLLMASLYST